MIKRLIKLAAPLIIVAAAIGIGFVMAMRAKYPPVQDFVRRAMKQAVNPETLKTAGQPGAAASIVRHRGRTSGTPYETPISAMATESGFVIPLPYGTTADWYKNVMAAGTADIVNEGHTYGVDHPELISAAVAEPYVSEEDQKLHQLFGVTDFLRVQKTDVLEPAETGSTA